MEPIRFRDKATGDILEVSPSNAANFEDSPDFERFSLKNPQYFVDNQDGVTIRADDIDALQAFRDSADFRPATQQETLRSQTAEFKVAGQEARVKSMKEFARERPFLAGGLAAAQQFSTGFTFGATAPLMSALGMPSEEREALSAASPIASAVGTGLGFAGGIAGGVALGGLGAAGAAAGETAAAATAAAGGGRIAQALAAARAAGTVAPATRTAAVAEAVAPVIAASTRAAGAAQAGLTALAPGVAATRAGAAAIGAGAAAAGVGATIPLQMVEAKIEGRELSGESIALQMGIATLLGGSISGISQHFKTASKFSADTEAGREYLAKLGKSRADRIYAAHAPDIPLKAAKQTGVQTQIDLVNEAYDRGLVGPFMDPLKMYNGVVAERQRVGKLIGEIGDLADEAQSGKRIDTSKFWDRVIDEVVEPLARSPSEQNEATIRKLLVDINLKRRAFPGDLMTTRELAEMSSQIGDEVYGATKFVFQDPSRTPYWNAMSQLRHKMAEEVGERAAQSGVPRQVLANARRQYQVAAHAERVAIKSVLKAAKSVGVKQEEEAFNKFANYSSVAVALLSGAPSGIFTKFGFEALKRAIPRAGTWYDDAIMRAVKAKAPAPIIENLEALSQQQRAAAAGLESSVAAMPSQAAIESYLSLYDDILQAGSRRLPRSYKDTILKARAIMEKGALKSMKAAEQSEALVPEGTSAFNLDNDILGDSIEKAREVLLKSSQPRKTSVRVPSDRPILEANRAGYQAVRELRDRLTASLADPSAMWGEQRAERAVLEAQRLRSVYGDPSRLARIRALGEATGVVKRQIEEKSFRLMGAPVGVSARRFGQKQKKEEAEMQDAAVKQAMQDAAADAELAPIVEVSP
jgi:hypothetical protein